PVEQRGQRRELRVLAARKSRPARGATLASAHRVYGETPSRGHARGDDRATRGGLRSGARGRGGLRLVGAVVRTASRSEPRLSESSDSIEQRRGGARGASGAARDRAGDGRAAPSGR